MVRIKVHSQGQDSIYEYREANKWFKRVKLTVECEIFLRNMWSSKILPGDCLNAFSDIYIFRTDYIYF